MRVRLIKGALLQTTQAVCGTHSATPLLPQLLKRIWLLQKPDTRIQQVAGTDVIADDLLHPHIGGNKLRKLDALLPDLEGAGCTDVVRAPQYTRRHSILGVCSLCLSSAGLRTVAHKEQALC